jgi:AraC family transcriptional regulator of adaptative response / DNA-3-methyladenine glycosylase II
MTEIAFRAGFRSLRRFNAVFAEVYRMPPTQVRRRGVEPTNSVTIEEVR